MEGTLDSLPRIHREDLRRFASERLARDRLVLGVVGDITPAELAELLRATFGVLPAKATPADVMEVSASFDGGVHIIDMDVPQSAMAFAQGGLKRDDPRFYSLTVLNQVLGGGGLTSRLFDEVREARVGLLRLHRAGSARSLGARPRRRGHGQRAGCGHNPGHPRPMAAARGGWRRHRRTRGQQNLSHRIVPLRLSGSGRIAALLVSVQLDNLRSTTWTAATP